MEVTAKHSNRILLFLILGGYLIVPTFLLFLPADYFDHDKPKVCLYTLATGIECWGCGHTRATMHLIHFEFEEAILFNKLSLVIVPVIAFMWLNGIYQTIKKIYSIYKK
jgi:hypothetical protein